ncbi:MAG: helix-turn-helix domain-containing protein [Firmicutes bacterium]|uniref:Helix-turn-helix domain-containing protein n=1 Tax=Candidatus Alloenteromonas pullistercoris TaxID=2840785 RepID=A0A9D9GW81_9FIRM|nr:helix-turn-helix domain-containing protein [Candidatus Enteromonas pullistercoris]
MLSHGNRLKEIAKALGLHPTALSREIRRNRSKTKLGDGECPIDARRFAFARKLKNQLTLIPKRQKAWE